ncbi:hypothetical protein BJ912DRAFT_922970 [Pholiota molesta]|nr:hypothetical protein BJ912DRAFT_922970 [Pholiota molesta]
MAIPHLSDPDDIALCIALDYLVRERFIAATYRSNAFGFMDVRIYLIPYDLSNVQGKLRIRKDTILNEARRYLRDLFPRISQDVDRWNGLRPTDGETMILPPSKDSRTLAEIYSDLTSPQAVPIPGYGNIASRLLDFQDDLDVSTTDGCGAAAKGTGSPRRPDPLYIQVNTVDKNLSSSNPVIHANTPFYHQYLGEPQTVNEGSASNYHGHLENSISLQRPLSSYQPTYSTLMFIKDYPDELYKTYSRGSKPGLMKLHTQQPCECPEFDGFRVPNCTCKVATVSPFLQIRWKRLVIDEGHDYLSETRQTLNRSDEQLEASSITEDTDIIMKSPTSSSSHSSPSIPPQSDICQPPPLEMGRIWTKDDRAPVQCRSEAIHDSRRRSTSSLRGPRPGAIQVLKQVMEMVMIRHRIEDVEQDVVLPPVTQESVLLDLDPYVIKSFNALQANILINALIRRERIRIICSMHTMLTSFRRPWKTCRKCRNTINRAIERKMSEEDIRGLREAFKHLRIAYEDPYGNPSNSTKMWYTVYTTERACISGMDKDTWPGTEFGSRQNGFLHADRLLKCTKWLSTNLSSRKRAVVEQDHIFRLEYEESERKKGKRRRKAKKGDDFLSHMARIEREEAEEYGSTPPPGPTLLPDSPNRPSRLIASSLLAKMRIGSSASSKLNYIINEVQQYSKTENSSFSQNQPVSSTCYPQTREQLVLTFETSETYRVFLMELKHGARGCMNLVSASRVIFCEPVWQADVESQAIKRAHRIGQTRPITVKTLAIRQTAEENMVARRRALKSSQEKLPKLLEEAGMRYYIANPKFITHEPVLTPTNKFPLVDLPPELLQPRPGRLC